MLRSILRLLPESMAFSLARFLASMPPAAPIRAADQEWLHAAEQISFGSGMGRRAWAQGQGPLVIFVHGWGGRAAQLVVLAQRLVGQGYRVVVFDALAHGESPGRHADFSAFIEDLAALAQQLNQPIHALVGHSAGALCMMAARTLKDVSAQCYVCLCAPHAPYVPVREIKQRLDPGLAVLGRFEDYYAESFGVSWQSLDQAHAFRDLGQGRLLLVYDVGDTRVDHRDAERITKAWPQAKVIKTHGLGHQKVLWDIGVAQDVAAFLRDEDVPEPYDPAAPCATVTPIRR